jgi:hypothetical protein
MKWGQATFRPEATPVEAGRKKAACPHFILALLMSATALAEEPAHEIHLRPLDRWKLRAGVEAEG